MSTNPNAMQMMLAQQLMQQPQPQSAGGGMGGPQMQGQTSPLNAGAQLAQKLMLMRALQGQHQQQQANSMLPQTNQQIAQDPTMAALQNPMPGAPNG
jgi:hypothetical protein